MVSTPSRGGCRARVVSRVAGQGRRPERRAARARWPRPAAGPPPVPRAAAPTRGSDRAVRPPGPDPAGTHPILLTPRPRPSRALRSPADASTDRDRDPTARRHGPARGRTPWRRSAPKASISSRCSSDGLRSTRPAPPSPSTAAATHVPIGSAPMFVRAPRRGYDTVAQRANSTAGSSGRPEDVAAHVARPVGRQACPVHAYGAFLASCQPKNVAYAFPEQPFPIRGCPL